MGRKYAIFDDLGFPKVFYDSDIHGDKIPEGAIEITEEQWLEFINNQGQRYWKDGKIEIFDPERMKITEQGIVEKSFDDFKQEKLQQLKSYVSNLLSQTDWVVIKLQSMKEEGWSNNEIQVEVQKYQPILEKRKRIREWNEQTEQAIQNAKTIEELEAIKIEFEG